MNSKEDKKEWKEGMNFNVPPGKDGFDVPKDYFEGLTDKVMSRLAVEEKMAQPSRTARIRQLVFQPAFAYAAMITGLLIAAVILIDKPEHSDVFAVITEEDAYTYVYNNIDEYTTEEITSVAGSSLVDDEILNLTEDQINIALDAFMDDLDPDELDELF